MTNIPTSRTYLQVRSGLPNSGGPHAIFLPRQKRHARVCLLSEANFLLASTGLRCKARRLGDITLSLGDTLRNVDVVRFLAFGKRGNWKDPSEVAGRGASSMSCTGWSKDGAGFSTSRRMRLSGFVVNVFG